MQPRGWWYCGSSLSLTWNCWAVLLRGNEAGVKRKTKTCVSADIWQPVSVAYPQAVYDELTDMVSVKSIFKQQGQVAAGVCLFLWPSRQYGSSRSSACTCFAVSLRFPIKTNERNISDIYKDIRMFMKAFPHPLSSSFPSWFIFILSLPFFPSLAIFYSCPFPCFVPLFDSMFI